MKFAHGEMVIRKTGGPVMVVIDAEQSEYQWVANGIYKQEHIEPDELISLVEWLDIAASRRATEKEQIRKRERRKLIVKK